MNALALSLVNALAIAPTRLEVLLARAQALGCTGALIDVRGESVLSITVWDGSRILGHLHRDAPDEWGDEKWHLSVSCDALAGLPMQADWLLEGAKRVRDVFNALVQP